MDLIPGPWQDQSSGQSAGIGSSPSRPSMDGRFWMRKLGRVVIEFGDGCCSAHSRFTSGFKEPAATRCRWQHGQWSPPLLRSVGSEPGPPIEVKQLVVVETGLCKHVGASDPAVHFTSHQQALNSSWVSTTPGSLPSPPRCGPAGRDEQESDRLKFQWCYSRTNTFPTLINVFLSLVMCAFQR